MTEPISEIVNTSPMTAESLILSTIIVLGCALLILLVGRKLRLPILIGYFLTGIIIGPSCLHFITEEEVKMLADMGVILMMFTIGLETPLKKLLEMKKIVLIGGTLQLVLTTAAVTGILMAVGMSFNVALFIGFLVAHSSTAIIMNLYQRSGEIDKPHGKIALGLLIFQDLNVIPMMLLVPFLSPSDNPDIVASIIKLLIGLGSLTGILIAAVYLVPKILRHIALTRNGELFIIGIVVISLGIAVLMNFTGVELSLGAFIAGVAISGTEYSHEVLGLVSPLRDILTSFFFISIGMMLNLKFVWENIGFILLLAVFLLLLKTGINFLSSRVIGVSKGVSLLAAVGLSQIGEFSFILGQTGLNSNILDTNTYQFFLAISILTMTVTPLLVTTMPKIIKRFNPDKVPQNDSHDPMTEEHEIIVGYGLTGQYVVKALEKMKIEYVVLETNAKTVSTEQKKGIPIIFGDATRDAVLSYAGIEKATDLVITIPQQDVIKAIVGTARRMNPNIIIITRTQFISDTAELYKLGADAVIVDERESAIQMFQRIIATRNMPAEDVEQLSKIMRRELYDRWIEQPYMFMKRTGKNTNFLESLLVRVRQTEIQLSKEMEQIQEIEVMPNSDVCNKRLNEIHFRRNYGVSILAIKHPGNEGEEVSPNETVQLKAGDIVVILCDYKKYEKILQLFTNKP